MKPIVFDFPNFKSIVVSGDEDLLDDVKRERKVMDDLYAYLYSKSHPLRHWFYGHFHQKSVKGIKFVLTL